MGQGDRRSVPPYYTPDIIGSKQKKNNGEVEQYYIEKHHPIIIEEAKEEINCQFIDYREPGIVVKMPTTDCILGDKLTAFAPNTTGIPYGKDKELEIIKQLFDVANLFDTMQNIEEVAHTSRLMAQQELIYRGTDDQYTYQDVLDDIFETSRIIGERGGRDRETFELLQIGIGRIKDYIFSRNFIFISLKRLTESTALFMLQIYPFYTIIPPPISASFSPSISLISL